MTHTVVFVIVCDLFNKFDIDDHTTRFHVT